MAYRPGPLKAFTDHLENVSTSPRARRAVAAWAVSQPDLAGHGDAAHLAAAIRSASDPADQDRLFTAVLRLAAGDPLAQLVAVAALEGHLRRIVARWATAGVDPSDLAVLEADLVAECWAAVRRFAHQVGSGSPPPLRPALAVVTAAWVAARAPRLRELRSPLSRMPLAEASHLPSETDVHPALEVQRLLVDAVGEGSLDLRSATLIFSTRIAGLSVEDAARRFGVTPESLRQLRTRAERRLARCVHRSARATAAA